MTTRRAVWLSLLWLGAGIAAGLPLLLLGASSRAVSYWAVYVVERSLSLDNVFIFLIILDAFAVPRPSRRNVVRWGIAFALVLRAVAIVVGVQLIERFSVVTYVLGAALLLFAVRMLRTDDGAFDPQRSRALRTLRRFVRSPQRLALVAFVVADLTFAIDSIPAAFGITTDSLAIWFANAAALVGLVPLLVLVRALVQRFRYMRQTMAAVLAFIGAKLLVEHRVAVGPVLSLAGIAAILAVGVAASIVADSRDSPHAGELAERRPPRCPPMTVSRERV